MDEVVLVRTISEIDPNSMAMKDLQDLAFGYGLFDMTEVILQVAEMLQSNRNQLFLIITPDNYRQIVKTILAMAILNYASVSLKSYAILMPMKETSQSDEFLVQKFKRTMTAEDHQKAASGYLAQAKGLIDKYSVAPE